MKIIHGDCLEEMDKLIAEGIKVDAIITDPPYGITAGSGTTAIACINTNRNFIGFELDEGYRNIANKRIQDRLSEK